MFICFSNLVTDLLEQGVVCGVAALLWVGNLDVLTVNLVGRRSWSRRLALGWPFTMSQEERLSHCFGSPLCAGRLGDFIERSLFS